MPNWKRPSWVTEKWDPLKVTDAQIEAWKQEEADCNRANAAERERLKGVIEQIQALAQDVYGPFVPYRAYDAHTGLKAIMKLKAPIQPVFSFHDVTRKIEQAKETAAKAAAQEESVRKQERAVAYLFERGKFLGTDFHLDTALKAANQLAVEIAINDMPNKHRPPYDFFDADNCDDGCPGWDGRSDRCACRGTRVWWEPDWNHDFEHPAVLPATRSRED